MAKKRNPKNIETITHDDATRKNIPTAEYQSVLHHEQTDPISVEYARKNRNRDLDPQLVWRGKDEQDWSDLVVQAPPLYIQEKIHPKVLIDDLAAHGREETQHEQLDLFADFNGVPDEADNTDFYEHDQNWTNRMILGDSLSVMASLAEREGLRGKVQCIYLDPPYGIKFNSNFQWSTTSRDVKDGSASHITREPEQVKAFRDTWRDGIHSYLTYLRDRLTVARDLLTESGSIFVQIGDENVHRVRALMDEVFGSENWCSTITVQKTGGLSTSGLKNVADFVIWYAKDVEKRKYRQAFREKTVGEGHGSGGRYTMLMLPDGKTRRLTKDETTSPGLIPKDGRVFRLISLTSIGANPSTTFQYSFQETEYNPPANRCWSTNRKGLRGLEIADRIVSTGRSLNYLYYLGDFPAYEINNVWTDIASPPDKVYVVQSHARLIQRCLLMTTDPGDLVLDPTCGSGTTAYVAEQWGRRWLTIDTSRVALALARGRIMGARYPYYLLADSKAGQQKEAQLSQRTAATQPVFGNIRHGFVYERVPHITLKAIANNAEIDVIWETWQPQVEAALAELNSALRGHAQPFPVTSGGRKGESVQFDAPADANFTMPSGETVPANELVEWEVPREQPKDWPAATESLLADFWSARIGRQKEIDASIAAKADFETLYDKPYEDKKTVRVAGPFTVESLSPHRVLGVDEDDELIDPLQTGNGLALKDSGATYSVVKTFPDMVLDNLRAAGVQQAHKEDKINFSSVVPWPGDLVCAEGRYIEDAEGSESGEGVERRAAIFIGPEFGTVQRVDLVAAAREAGDGGFDVLIACAFAYEGHTTQFSKLGHLPVLKARMNADLHMADDLKNTGKGNLFVIFGEPDIDLIECNDGQIQVKVNGVDVFHPSTGEVRSDNTDGIACWFVDTDYNEESFFVRHAYFLGANDPYKSLKTTLKAEINAEAWETLHSDISRPFARPSSGRIAVKVINHLGDEVMKVFRV